MQYINTSEAQQFFLTITSSNLGVINESPTIMIINPSGNYWNGSAWQGTLTRPSMNQTDFTNEPGLYDYSLVSTAIQTEGIYRVMYKNENTYALNYYEQYYATNVTNVISSDAALARKYQTNYQETTGNGPFYLKTYDDGQGTGGTPIGQQVLLNFDGAAITSPTGTGTPSIREESTV